MKDRRGSIRASQSEFQEDRTKLHQVLEKPKMKMISLKEAKKILSRFTDRKADPRIQKIILYTFKKDRWISLAHAENGLQILSEHGYENQEHTADPVQIRKETGKAFSREFPRSSRLYIQIITEKDPKK